MQRLLGIVTSLVLSLSLVAVPALALADSTTVAAAGDETHACFVLTLVSGASTQTAGYTETTQVGPTTALLPTSYSGGALSNAVLTQPVVPPWIDPVTDANFVGSGAAWISTHATWPGGTLNTEGSASADQWRLFQDSFTLPVGAVVSSATLAYTADNATDVYVNGNATPVASTGDTYGAVPGALPQYFGTVFTAPLTVAAGANTLNFVIRNWGGDYTSNPTGLLYKATVHYCVPITPPPPATVTVSIDKYLNGALATAGTANSVAFPMVATWAATNIGAGSGNYTLSTTGFNSPTPYEAVTADMTAGADYTTSEITTATDASSPVAPIGAACVAPATRLVGYQASAISFADAATQAITATAPVFTALTGNRYVIVLNETCPPVVVGTGSINGYKYEDKNGNGVLSAREHHGIAGVTIYLDTNNSSTLDTGEPTTVTDAAGAYHFTGLVAGTYHVREVVTTGWTQTYPATGVHDVTLSAAQTASGINFGNFHLGTISGMKYNDLNGNGKKNVGEAGLAGWTIKLTKVGGGTVSTVTDATGAYTFTGLTAGTYTLTEVMQPGWTQTDHPHKIHIKSGTAITKADFGNTTKVKRCDNNGHDVEHDGDQDDD